MNTDPRHLAALTEAVVTAHREAAHDCTLRFAPAWHDLDEASRVRAFDETLRQRALEAAGDPRGFSATTHAVLRRLHAR